MHFHNADSSLDQDVSIPRHQSSHQKQFLGHVQSQSHDASPSAMSISSSTSFRPSSRSLSSSQPFTPSITSTPPPGPSVTRLSQQLLYRSSQSNIVFKGSAFAAHTSSLRYSQIRRRRASDYQASLSTSEIIQKESNNVLEAAAGLITGVTASGMGVIGSIHGKVSGDVLPPVSFRHGPTKNFLQNNDVSHELLKFTSLLGLNINVGEGEDGPCKNANQRDEPRAKFLPVSVGDLVYFTGETKNVSIHDSTLSFMDASNSRVRRVPEKVSDPNITDSAETATMYVTSTGAFNDKVGAVVVTDGEEMGDLFYCLFRVWLASEYNDWHADGRRPFAQPGEHGFYRMSVTKSGGNSDEDEDGDNETSPDSFPDDNISRDFASNGKDSNNKNNKEDRAFGHIFGSSGRRPLVYDDELIFEHVATGKVLSSLPGINSTIDHDSTALKLSDRLLASHGHLRNKQRDSSTFSSKTFETVTSFAISPRFKSRQAGSVFDGDLVKLETNSGSVSVSEASDILGMYSSVPICEVNLKHDGNTNIAQHFVNKDYGDLAYEDIQATSGNEFESMRRQNATRQRSHSTLTTSSAKKASSSVLTLHRFSSWTPPNTFINYGDGIRIFNPEIDAYLWGLTGKYKSPFYRKVKHDHALGVDFTFASSAGDCNKVVTSPKSIFVIERFVRDTGGVVKWGDKIRLKHLVTGKYLGVVPTPNPSVQKSKFTVHGIRLVDFSEATNDAELFDDVEGNNSAFDNGNDRMHSEKHYSRASNLMSTVFTISPGSTSSENQKLNNRAIEDGGMMRQHANSIFASKCFAILSHALFAEETVEDGGPLGFGLGKKIKERKKSRMGGGNGPDSGVTPIQSGHHSDGEDSEDESEHDESSFSSTGHRRQKQLYLHATVEKKTIKRKRLRDLFDPSVERGECWNYDKGEGGNTESSPQPKGSCEITFSSRFFEKDVVKIEAVDNHEMQSAHFALSAIKTCESYIRLVYQYKHNLKKADFEGRRHHHEMKEAFTSVGAADNTNRPRNAFKDSGKTLHLSSPCTRSTNVIKTGSLVHVSEMLMAVQDFCNGLPVFADNTSAAKFALDLDQIKMKEKATRIVQGTKLLDKIFAMYASPKIYGLQKEDLMTEPELLKIHQLVGRTIAIITAGKRSQIYCAMQHFDCGLIPFPSSPATACERSFKIGGGKIINHLRNKSGSLSPKKNVRQRQEKEEYYHQSSSDFIMGGEEIFSGHRRGVGFLASLLSQISWNIGASQILDNIMTNNHVLVKELVDNKLIQHFISCLLHEAPETPTLDILTSINICTNANSSPTAVIDCQESLVKCFFPQSEEEFSNIDVNVYCHNRRQALLETSLAMSKRAKKRDNKTRHLSRGLLETHTGGCELVVSWEGRDDYNPSKKKFGDRSNINGLFYSADGLNLKYRYESDSSLIITADDWNAYLKRFYPSESSQRQWVRLSDFVWTIDPEAHHGADRWAQIRHKLEQSKLSKERYFRAQKLAKYYLGTLRLFTNMCMSRSDKVIKAVEKQFSYESLVSGIADERLPNYTRSLLAQLMFVLYLDRFPHEELLLPQVVRVYDELHYSKDAIEDIDVYLNSENRNRVKVAQARKSSNGENFSSCQPNSHFSIMQDSSVKKFNSLQMVIFSILRSAKMCDQFSPSRSRSYARRIADKVHLTLSVLLMAKNLLFCGYFHDSDSLSQLLAVLEPLMTYGIQLAKKENKGIFSSVRSASPSSSMLSPSLSLSSSSLSSDPKETLTSILKNSISNGNIGGGDIEMKQQSRPQTRSRPRAKSKSDEDDTISLVQESKTEKLKTKIGADMFDYISRQENILSSLHASLRNEGDISSINDIGRTGADVFYSGMVAVDEIVERQRFALGKWSMRNLTLPGDRDPFTTPEHLESIKDLDFGGPKITDLRKTMKKNKKSINTDETDFFFLINDDPRADDLPTATSGMWTWVDENWTISDTLDGVKSKETSKWLYSFAWPSSSTSEMPNESLANIFKNRNEPVWWAKTQPAAFVRNRRWTRRREVLSLSQIAEKYCEKMDRRSLGHCFRQAVSESKTKIGSAQVIDLNILMHSLERAVAKRRSGDMEMLPLRSQDVSKGRRRLGSDGDNSRQYNAQMLLNEGDFESSNLLAGNRERSEKMPSSYRTSTNSLHVDENAAMRVGQEKRTPNNSDNTNLPEVRKAIIDSTKCRGLVCDMIIYLSGLALDLRISTLAAEIKEAHANNTPLCGEGAKESNKKLNTSLFVNSKTYSKKEIELTFIKTALKKETDLAFTKNLTLKGREVFDKLFVDSSSSSTFGYSRPKETNNILSCSSLDLNDSSARQLTNNLLDLLLVTNDEELVEKIMCSLFLHFSRKSMLVQRLSETHLLMDNDSINVYLEIVNSIAILKNNLSSFDSWGREGEEEIGGEEDDHFPAAGHFPVDGGDCGGEKLKETVYILNRFEKHCYKKSGMPHAPRQLLFEKLEVHLLAIEILEMKIKQNRRTKIGMGYCLRKIQRAASRFICGFIDGNLMCKKDILKTGSVANFMSLIGCGVGISKVLTSIYSENASVARDVPKTLLIDFAASILRRRDNFDLSNLFRYMSFFRSLLEVNGVIMRRNQSIVMEIFADPNFSPILLTYVDITASNAFSSSLKLQRDSLLTEFKQRNLSTTSFKHICLHDRFDVGGKRILISQNFSRSERLLYYHSRVVELMSLCCTANENKNELLCARLIPFAHLHCVLVEAEYMLHAPFVWVAFAKFAKDVYFDRDKTNQSGDVKRIEDLNLAWGVIESVSNFLVVKSERLFELIESREFDPRKHIRERGENQDIRGDSVGQHVSEADNELDCVLEFIFDGGLPCVDGFARNVATEFSDLDEYADISNEVWDMEGISMSEACAIKKNLSRVLTSLAQKKVVDLLTRTQKKCLKQLITQMGIFCDSNIFFREGSKGNFVTGKNSFGAISPRAAPKGVSPGNNDQSRIAEGEDNHANKRNADMKGKRIAKREFSAALLESDYIGNQLVQEFNDLVDLFLKFGKNKDDDAKSDKDQASGKKNLRKKKKNCHKNLFVQHIVFEEMIKKLITHVRKLMAGMVEGQGKSCMASGKNGGGLLNNALFGFKSSAPMILRLLGSCVLDAGVMWSDDDEYEINNEEKIDEMRQIMVRCGAAELVVDLLTSSEGEGGLENEASGSVAREDVGGANNVKSGDGDSINSAFVKQEALRFACTILNGGSKFVQDKFYNYLHLHPIAASKFFSGIYGHILQATRIATSIRACFEAMKFKKGIAGERGSKDDNGQMIWVTDGAKRGGGDDGIRELFEVKDELNVGLIFRMLQLLAEGHNLKMQRLLQDQTTTIGLMRSRNLVLVGAELIKHLAFDTSVMKKMHLGALDELTQLFNFLTECMQGPCYENQELLVKSNIAQTVETVFKYAHSQAHAAGTVFNAGGVKNLSKERRKEINDLFYQSLPLKRKNAMKRLCLAAATCLNSMLEGREESSEDIVHDYLVTKLSPLVLLRSMTGAYVNFRVHKRNLSTNLVERLPVIGAVYGVLQKINSIFELGVDLINNQTGENLIVKMSVEEKAEMTLYHKGQCELALGVGNEIIVLLNRLANLDASFETQNFLGTSSARGPGGAVVQDIKSVTKMVGDNLGIEGGEDGSDEDLELEVAGVSELEGIEGGGKGSEVSSETVTMSSAGMVISKKSVKLDKNPEDGDGSTGHNIGDARNHEADDTGRLISISTRSSSFNERNKNIDYSNSHSHSRSEVPSLISKQATKYLGLQKKGIAFFDRTLRSIEIVWGEHGLKKVYFALPTECLKMNGEIVENVNSALDYSDDDRIKTLMKMVPAIHAEIKWQQTLNKLHFPQNQSTNKLNALTFVVSLAINFLIIINLEYSETSKYPKYVNSDLTSLIWWLGIVNVAFAGLKVLQIIMLKVPVLLFTMLQERQKAMSFGGESQSKRREIILALRRPVFYAVGLFFIRYSVYKRYPSTDSVNSSFEQIIYVCYGILGFLSLQAIDVVATKTSYTSRFFLWYSFFWQSVNKIKFYGIMSMCAVFGLVYIDTPIAYAVQLFIVIEMSPTLQNVVRAVTIPSAQLLMSALLGLIIIYVFSLVGFYTFHSDMMNTGQNINECNTMLNCVRSYIRNGMLYGGGIGDFMSGELGHDAPLDQDDKYVYRLIFDMAFFIIVIVLLMNIVFGIIIDTFGSLRESENERHELMQSRCFICGLSKDLFEDMRQSGGRGFSSHWKEEHNYWNYIFFVIYLEKKDTSEYNGAESYIADCVKNEDIGWIPDGIALAIPRVDEEKMREERMEAMFRQLEFNSLNSSEDINSELAKMNKGITKQIEGLRRKVTKLKSDQKRLMRTVEDLPSGNKKGKNGANE